ncbi:MAG: hypothetical protein A2167_06525 [Planctomycetes bacterium RBG_13_46_10]|nr:MAG: hypothetical protein A2167_06525 [Planctomycetes bacterium RBG_13_46_10]
MKRLIIFILFLNLASVLKGEVSIRVCQADGNTPLELADPNIPFVYRDIMVGTRLTLIISSDVKGSCDGFLLILGDDVNRGFLSARDYNDITGNWEGSCLPAAGNRAYVLFIVGLGQQGISLGTVRSPMAGDWFIIDYTALSVGVCTIIFYDYSGNRENPFIDVEPITYYLVFSHVPTCDFNNDTKVDFADFAVFASHWQRTNCPDAGGCVSVDLDMDGNIDWDDLSLFTDYWLGSKK